MSASDTENFRRAFELAYFIHPNTDIALSVVEAAMCKLEHTFGRQGRRFYYVPVGRVHHRGRSSQAPRTKVSLRPEHLLQILIYIESDSYERSSEYGNSRYPLTDEDMVLRFLKHLVQITIKRNSFYVTLGIGRLLYEYETSQVRQMYDVLMQDHGRFRDNSYLRKQKKILMTQLSGRFDRMIRWTRTAQGEDRFLAQPTTERLIRFVHECLVRFIPWDTPCVLPKSFDPVARIPALSFTGANPDNESPIEMSRIHTIIDPDCFSRLVTSLGFPASHERLAVPQFFYSDSNSPRGDRFNPPSLSEQHKVRLERARKDRARRRKTYRRGLLRVFVDDLERISFDPRRMDSVKLRIDSAAKTVEVRGKDKQGDLALATLLVTYDDVPPGQSLIDSLKLEGGQKLTIVLTPNASTTGEIEGIDVQIRYAETHPLPFITLLVQRAWFGSGKPEPLTTDYSWLLKVAVVLAIVLVAFIFIWHQVKQRHRELSVPVQVKSIPSPTFSPEPTLTPTPERVQNPKPSEDQIASASWETDGRSVANAIRLEIRRGDLRQIEIKKRVTTLLVAVNQVDAEYHPYHSYRIKLSTGEKVIWERILQSPRVPRDTRVYVLKLGLSPDRFPQADSYKLEVEGESRAGWQAVGQLILKPVSH